MVSDDEILQVPRERLDEGLEQAWIRTTREPDIKCVSAQELSVRHNAPTGGWKVNVAAMEFVRGGDETEAVLREKIMSALGVIPGVTNVYAEDREVWGIAGDPSGYELVAAAGAVVDRFADRIRVARNAGLDSSPSTYTATSARKKPTIEQRAEATATTLTDAVHRLRSVPLDSDKAGDWSEIQTEGLAMYFEQLVADIRANPGSPGDLIDVKELFNSVGMVGLPPHGAVTVASVRAADSFNRYAKRVSRLQ